MLRKIGLYLFSISLIACNTHNKELRVNRYFERIRNDSAQLTAFLAEMPKGGDLHNHYSGSVYAERYIDYVVGKDYWIDTTTLKIFKVKDSVLVNKTTLKKGIVLFSGLKAAGKLPAIQNRLLEKWSVKDFNFNGPEAADEHFFNTFVGFSIASGAVMPEGLLELKQRAKSENLQYIETQLLKIPFRCTGLETYNRRLEEAAKSHREEALKPVFDSLYKMLIDSGCAETGERYAQWIDSLHTALQIDDSLFTMRYQVYATRISPPADVFAALLASFTAVKADKNKLIAGVNIVGQENNPTSMKDYWLHMEMFKYFHAIDTTVPYSMHAGELSWGKVKPEELTNHINEAVNVAGAKRIGHGVDMPYEFNGYQLMAAMRGKKIPVEINLSSNEFILNIKGSEHAILLYKKAGVPIVISSDDPGVSRSSITMQYVLLAERYKSIKYSDIKKFVYNSITYSFMDKALKEKQLAELQARFDAFENAVCGAGSGK